MQKKLFSALFVFITIILLVGCMESSDSSNDSEEDGLTTITTVRTQDDGTVYKDGEDVNDNVVTRWAEEELDINFEYLWTRPNDEQYNQQIRLMMSSNEPLPDVFQVTDTQLIADLVESGKVQPIGEVIDEHAPDRLKDIFNEFSDAFNQATIDGERYGLPRFSGGNGTESLMWVRQDWLDNLGLEAPETLEELEAVMDAFVNEDPDGNGEDDTFGLLLSAGEVGFGRTNIGDTSPVFGMYGDYVPGLWSEDENGDLVYGSIQESMKDGLVKMKEWMGEGYISQELAIAPADQAQEIFVSGKAGLAFGPPWAWDWPFGETKTNDPDAVIKPYQLPSGPDGEMGRKGESLLTGSFLFSSEFDDWDKFFEYWDETYGYILNDSEYFEDGLFEGYDYIMVDGEPVYDANVIEEETGEEKIDPGRYFLPTNVPTFPYKMYGLLQEFHENPDKEPSGAYETDLAQRDPEYIEAAAIINRSNDIRIENKFTGAPTETMADQWSNLEQLELEIFADIVMGNVEVDAFDDFVEEWKERGGDQITEEVNEWYDQVQSAE
ncbi:extracellular solute-binding protein [Gracilibacillus saliphilus]|uniref:extracellular solute-binding protein n=1 Tax=Gracilibacillus saliphilus TaxID=543890 RepID=UPI0013D6D097|nr:extracellular solute-binding protein [Gracilibacillus saliphilus]